MARNISPDNLAAAVSATLQYYDMELQGQIQKAVDDIAKELKAEIIESSPVESGKYKKGWRLSHKFADARTYIVIVHNKPRYRIVHLIEHGRGTTGVGAHPHLGIPTERANDKLLNRIDDIIGSW